MLREEIEQIIRKDVNDPRIGFFTITYVHITPDLKNVKIGISFIGSDEEKNRSFEGILSAKKYIQFKLGKKISLKYTPIIEFEFDQRKEFRIEEILKEIKKENET
ncbi:MAG: 30S ribosome-binding factor RbfA [Candidatus Omnitrophica bacterium]|nr:30S ribosome-binding factor RbfA [Candidatus Omnitrophota bacterium]